MRFLGLLILLAGVALYLPAWERWMQLIFGMMNAVVEHRQMNAGIITGIAPPVFEQAGLGAVLFWVGAIMMLAFRR